VRVDGSTGTRIQRNIDEFNTSPACRVYVSQVATGIGITLNSANYAFFYSVPWSLGEYIQASGRNYRIGQKNKVVVFRLFGAGTVELVKAQVLQDKADVSATITSKLACSACPKQAGCAKEGIELFDANCIHQRSVRRTIAKAKELL
jgi:SNF2 family DNA or RNA helicase